MLGDAARLVPVEDDDALAAALAFVVSDESQRADLIECGRARAAGYTWEKAANEFATLYERLAGRTR